MSIHRTTLIEQAKLGDKVALERLLVLHLDQLSAHIARRMPPAIRSGAFSVEDVTQDALLEAFLKIDRLQGTSPGCFIAWLKAVGEFTLIRFIRDESRQKRGGWRARSPKISPSISGNVMNLLERIPGPAGTASSQVARRESVSAMQAAMVRLAPEQRRAIQLNLIEGMTLEQTARAMGNTPAAVRGLVYRGKKRLAEMMKR